MRTYILKKRQSCNIHMFIILKNNRAGIKSSVEWISIMPASIRLLRKLDYTSSKEKNSNKYGRKHNNQRLLLIKSPIKYECTEKRNKIKTNVKLKS